MSLIRSPGEITWLRRDAASLRETLAWIEAEYAEAQARGDTFQMAIIARNLDAVEDDLACTEIAISEATGEPVGEA